MAVKRGGLLVFFFVFLRHRVFRLFPCTTTPTTTTIGQQDLLVWSTGSHRRNSGFDRADSSPHFVHPSTRDQHPVSCPGPPCCSNCDYWGVGHGSLCLSISNLDGGNDLLVISRFLRMRRRRRLRVRPFSAKRPVLPRRDFSSDPCITVPPRSTQIIRVVVRSVLPFPQFFNSVHSKVARRLTGYSSLEGP